MHQINKKNPFLIRLNHDQITTRKDSYNGRFDKQSIEQLESANQELLDKVHKFRESVGLPKALIFDLDSTHSDTYGNQEDTAFNSHYGTVGYHPLVAFDGVTGDFLKA